MDGDTSAADQRSSGSGEATRGVDLRQVDVGWFVEAVHERRPFTFTRWGDGEWSCVIPGLAGERPFNSDRHRFFPELGDDLREILRERPDYLLGMQPLALVAFETQIVEFLAGDRLDELDWIDASPLHRASREGHLGPLVRAITRVPLVLVGPAHLKSVASALGAERFVEVPLENCYLQLERIHEETTRSLASMPDGTFVSVSAGMPANVIVDRLHARFGERHMLVDIGSLWDLYAGVLSRGYMRKIGARRLPLAE